MKLTACVLAIFSASLYAQSKEPLVEFDMMTWSEVKQAIQAGKTTALVYNGGTEQRGPQNVNGAHTLIARETGRRIALKLGNAILAPVLPYSPNAASADLPGTIGLTPQLFAAMNEQIAEQLIISGFKNVVLMGDHGGGQKELGEVAKKLDDKYSGKGIRVVFCDQVYVGTTEHPGAQADFIKWLGEQGYPAPSGHAGVMDTSEMVYLGSNKGWVRMNLIPTALGNPIGAGGRAQNPNAPPTNNGISGDARRSSAELGKKFIDMKVEYAVRQINQLLAAKSASRAQ
jgi:creatinine amidohydrolase/Fe(II)-dependent formamide hydrolase-like protein